MAVVWRVGGFPGAVRILAVDLFLFHSEVNRQLPTCCASLAGRHEQETQRRIRCACITRHCSAPRPPGSLYSKHPECCTLSHMEKHRDQIFELTVFGKGVSCKLRERSIDKLLLWRRKYKKGVHGRRRSSSLRLNPRTLRSGLPRVRIR